ncbi:MAG: response regulator [Acidobacteria bacterium]|nr:response regulator [Acidobacteriota bacterium]MCA1650500.1 response regulator [Acidobacteriota bacterium]
MPARVLIVDDDEVFLTTMKQLLEMAGHQVLVASTFEDGRRVLRTAAPDVLIADVRLGPFNGLQLIAMEALNIPVIVISGFDDVVLQAAARSMGADYMVKPFSSDALLDRVEQKLADAAGGAFQQSRLN